MNRIRVALGILLVLAFVIQGLSLSARMMLGLFQDATVGSDQATRGEKRFHTVLGRLPARGVYGYRASGPLRIGEHQEVEGDDRAIAQYVTAQYTLAPRILDLGPGRPLVIHDDADAVRVLGHEEPMMLALLLGLILPVAAGYFWSGSFRAGSRAERLAPLLRTCLGVGLAIGTSSCAFYAWIVLAGRPGTAYIGIDIALFVGLALAGAVVVRRRDGAGRLEVRPEAVPQFVGVILRGALLVSLGAGIALFLMLRRVQPHGSWDAIATWNLRARFLYRGGDSWAGVHPLLLPTHLDYPLLVPTSVARCWVYAGRESPLAPALLSLVFTLATAGLLVSGLAALRGRTQGVLGGLVLLATPLLFQMSSSQVADIPLAYFILATVVALALGDQAGGVSVRFPALAGMMSGFAVWTKNEGLVFLAVVLMTRLVVTVSRGGWRAYRREAVTIALGLAPVLAVCLHFKLRFAPPSDFVAGQGPAQIVAKLADLSRHALVIKEFAEGIASLGGGMVVGMAVYLLLLGPAPRGTPRPGAVFATTVLALLLAAYHLTYVVTPRHLPWHLQWSFARLILQLWPLGVFAFFLVATTPEEALAKARPSDHHSLGQSSDSLESGAHSSDSSLPTR